MFPTPSPPLSSLSLCGPSHLSIPSSFLPFFSKKHSLCCFSVPLFVDHPEGQIGIELEESQAHEEIMAPLFAWGAYKRFSGEHQSASATPWHTKSSLTLPLRNHDNLLTLRPFSRTAFFCGILPLSRRIFHEFGCQIFHLILWEKWPEKEEVLGKILQHVYKKIPDTFLRIGPMSLTFEVQTKLFR